MVCIYTTIKMAIFNQKKKSADVDYKPNIEAGIRQRFNISINGQPKSYNFRHPYIGK